MTAPVPSLPSLDRLRGKSLLIFDDGLQSVDGHWYEYDRAVAQMHVALGVKTTVVAHRSFDRRQELEQAGVEVLPLVAKSMWSGFGGVGSVFREFYDSAVLGAGFASVIRKLLRTARYDCVFVPNAQLSDLFAWLILGRIGSWRKVDRAVLLLRFGLGQYDDRGPPKFARKLAIWRYVLRAQQSALRLGLLHFVTDSGRLSDEYGALSGVFPAVIPGPRTVPPPAAATARLGGADMVFATLGAARIGKGVDLFQQAIRRLIEAGQADGMRFLIQWNRDVPMPDGSIYRRDPLLVADARVAFIETALSTTAYDALFAQIDCMVLPYRRRIYHSQSSGVAVEAACAGIPIIYTDDSWLSDYVSEQGAGIAVEDGDVTALAAAIREIFQDRQRYAAAARDRSVVAWRSNSPEAFVRRLWGLDRPISATSGSR